MEKNNLETEKEELKTSSCNCSKNKFNSSEKDFRLIVKVFYFLAIICTGTFAILGIILIANNPNLYLVFTNQKHQWVNVGFYKVLLTLSLRNEYTATYLSYLATNNLSSNGIIYLVLGASSETVLLISFFLLRFLKSKNNVYHHMFSLWFTILFTSIYVVITAVGLANKVYNQSFIAYQLDKDYRFNIIFSFKIIVVGNNLLGFSFSWYSAGIAFTGLLVSVLFFLSLLFIWFSTKMLFRKPVQTIKKDNDLIISDFNHHQETIDISQELKQEGK